MKDALDMVQDGFNLVNVDDITTVITGGLYQLERPENSKLEDLVINALPITNNQLQQGVLNFNIHVPNLTLTIAGKTDVTQPDLARMKQIAKLVLAKVADFIGFDFRLSAANGGYPIRDNDNTWYLNIRVDYYSLQSNFINI